jgi:hypothetical protein
MEGKMWKMIKTEEFERRRKKYAKKKKNELASVLNNLDILVASLNLGRKLRPFVHGFMHPEPGGVIAIIQKGGGRSLAETRLYLYAVVERETLWLLTIGDKSSQGDDVKDCERWAEQIRNIPDIDGNQSDGHAEEDDRQGDEGGGGAIR